ncbi:Subfamily M3A non-peptidase ue [Paragonimus heterotremus]|uniref:Subfamily M3A non-peptidase ue n=1 Tax=Paragonimus heterotremus TaxID=100268 RepID=A0A8J4SP31_9TREM|nr:Subfamily M3A non-peptidase ue [Paragonimus heterotremus]
MLRALVSSAWYGAPRRCITHPRDVKFDHGPSYYVIPEIPSENLKVLPKLDLEKLPNLTELTPELAFNGFSRLIIDYQLSLSRLSEDLKKGAVQPSFSSVVQSLEEIFYPIEHGFQALRSISTFNTDPIWPLITGRLFQKLKSSRSEYFGLDAEIYRALLVTQSTNAQASQSDKEMLKALINDCRQQGAELSLAASGTPISSLSKVKPDQREDVNKTTAALNISQAKEKLDRFRSLKAELENELRQFQAMVFASSTVAGSQMAHSRFTGRLPNFSELVYLTGSAHIPVAESDLAPSTPTWLPALLGGRQNGGHVADMRVNIASDVTVKSLLRHCSTRQVRKSVWHSWAQRASIRSYGGSTGHHASNDARLQTVRRLRLGLAQLLGCEDWLALQWLSPHLCSPTSAQSLITDLLEPLRIHLQPIGQTELQLLTEWASAYLDLRGAKLEPWDIDYAIEQYNYAATYCPLQTHVTPPSGSLTKHVHALLDQLAGLFQLRLVPHSNLDNEVPVFRVEDVAATDESAFYGELILDLFEKPGRPVLLGQAISIPMTTRTYLSHTGANLRPKVGHHSVATLLSSFPLTSEKEGVTVQDLLSIAFGFGTCLQHILPEAHHHQLTGLSACLAADIRHLAGDLCAALMFNTVLGPLTATKTVDPKSGAQFYASPSGFRPPPNRIVALPLLYQLYEARFDLALWSHAERARHWTVLNDQLWSTHIPYAKHPEDSWPCSATDLFGPNSDATAGFQYHHVWRHVVLQDVLAALREHGWPANSQSAEVLEVLKRFRDLFIACKDRRQPAELFREFRGRDPSYQYLLDAIQIRMKSPAFSFTVEQLSPAC